MSNIQCFIHKKSFFVEGNLNYISINHELCLIYNTLFDLKINFTESLNNNNSNLFVENLPYVIYGGIPIKRTYLHSFFQKLINLEKTKNLGSDKNLQIELETLEKTLLFDMQMSLNLYTYFNYNQKTNQLWKVLKVMYQPWSTYNTYTRDKEILLEIRKLLGITSKYEAIDYIKKINKKIENLLIKIGGENYCKIVNQREINFMDLLIYASIKAQNRILDFTKLKKYNFVEYSNLDLLVKEIDSIILNKTQLLNKIKITSPNHIGIPKFTIIDKSFGRYLDIPMETPEIKRRTKIRKTVISVIFFGFLTILKLTHWKFYKIK